MTPLMFAFFLVSLSLSSAQRPSTNVRQDTGFYSAHVGVNLTLQCFYDKQGIVMVYWFKQILRQKPIMIASFYKHDAHGSFYDEFKNNSRFALKVGNGESHLQISDLHISDSGTYYCVGIDAQKFEFGDGATVSVEGSVLNIETSVHQSECETSPLGSRTQTCTIQTGTCDEEHSVYWFKNAGKFHPGLIYTQGGKNSQCERSLSVQTHTCVYNLPPESLNVSDCETHSCAVASCGHILFSDKSKMESADELNSSDFFVYLLSGALTANIVLIVFMVFSVYKMKQRLQCFCTAEPCGASSNGTMVDSEGYQDAENLNYAAVNQQRINRARRQTGDSPSQCVYSSVRL